MPVIRRRLTPDTVYPSDLRYDPDTGKVQSLINGEWEDNPNADPRTQTKFPPRVTADTDCDAAKSVVDQLKNQIDQIITAIDNAQTAFTIAGMILGLFKFGPYAIFITIALFIADLMIDAGQAALEAALTPAVYEQLECILYCSFSNGKLLEDSLPFIKGEVTAQIGGLAATVINAMLDLAGEGGINNLAALGTSTGDCSGCTQCAECEHDFDLRAGLMVGNPSPNVFLFQSQNFGTNREVFLFYGSEAAVNSCCVIESWTVISGQVDQTHRRLCGSTVTQTFQPLLNLSLHMAIWRDVGLGAQFTIEVTFSG